MLTQQSTDSSIDITVTYREERKVSGITGRPGVAIKKSQRESETLDINENAIKNELGLLSKAGTMFRAKLIEQFQLVYRIGKLRTLHFFSYTWIVCILLACFMLM